MAKRKRLTPARVDYLSAGGPAPETKSMFPSTQTAPPIAQVACDTALQAAVDDLSAELRNAQVEGRLVQNLPLDVIEETYLVRDRIAADQEEMLALIESLRARGQQVPIEVVDLGQGRFGLISGWRRLTALKALHAETQGDCFATVQAILRRPESASDAYLAMVEENEIRVGLSYYERARIVARSVEQGVYGTEADALRSLFASASRAKRSKIRSFLVIYYALDSTLKFASSIPERLGLKLSAALKDDQKLAAKLTRKLADADSDSPDAEAQVLTRALENKPSEKRAGEDLKEEPVRLHTIGEITLKRSASGKVLTLSGPGLTEDLQHRLQAWLAAQT